MHITSSKSYPNFLLATSELLHWSFPIIMYNIIMYEYQCKKYLLLINVHWHTCVHTKCQWGKLGKGKHGDKM